jgi:hypothetical protein
MALPKGASRKELSGCRAAELVEDRRHPDRFTACYLLVSRRPLAGPQLLRDLPYHTAPDPKRQAGSSAERQCLPKRLLHGHRLLFDIPCGVESNPSNRAFCRAKLVKQLQPKLQRTQM